MGLKRSLLLVFVILTVIGGISELLSPTEDDDNIQQEKNYVPKEKDIVICEIESRDYTPIQNIHETSTGVLYGYGYKIRDPIFFVIPENTEYWVVKLEWWRYDGPDEVIMTKDGYINKLGSVLNFQLGYITEYDHIAEFKEHNTGSKSGTREFKIYDIDHSQTNYAGSSRGNYWVTIQAWYTEFKITVTARVVE